MSNDPRVKILESRVTDLQDSDRRQWSAIYNDSKFITQHEEFVKSARETFGELKESIEHLTAAIGNLDLRVSKKFSFWAGIVCGLSALGTVVGFAVAQITSIKEWF